MCICGMKLQCTKIILAEFNIHRKNTVELWNSEIINDLLILELENNYELRFNTNYYITNKRLGQNSGLKSLKT